MHVYMVMNNLTGEYYVGKHAGDRLQGYFKHCVCAALRGSKAKPRLYNAIRKYGPEAFSCFSLISEVIDNELLGYLEVEMIALLHARERGIGYNICLGGQNGRIKGVKHPPDCKHCAWVRSGAMSGEKNPFFGKTHTIEFRKRIKEARTGCKDTVEARGRKSKALKKMWETGVFASRPPNPTDLTTGRFLSK